MPKELLICFALKEEAAPFQKRCRRHKDVALLVVGIGRANAERAIRNYLEKYSPRLVYTCGFAGGLKPALKVGDVLFENGANMASLRGLEARLMTAGARAGKFFCADHIATTVAEKNELRATTQADAVEMESAAIHAVCAEKKIPCVTVRVISDTANEDLPLDFNALAKPDKNLDFGKLAWAIAKSPGKIPQLMALQKKTSFAAHQLANVLEKIVLP